MFTDNSASWMFDPGPKESREEEAWKGQGQEDACMGQEINVAYMYYIVQSIWCITGIWEASDALNLPNLYHIERPNTRALCSSVANRLSTWQYRSFKLQITLVLGLDYNNTYQFPNPRDMAFILRINQFMTYTLLLSVSKPLNIFEYILHLTPLPNLH
jgi:hypothetical protein